AAGDTYWRNGPTDVERSETQYPLLVLKRLEDVQLAGAACGPDRGDEAGDDRGDDEHDERPDWDGERPEVDRGADQQGEEDAKRDPERGAQERGDDALVAAHPPPLR